MDNRVILALFVLVTLTLSQEDRVTFLPGYGAIPNDTVYAGNIPIANGKRSGTMFYLFFETSTVDKTVPIVLWLNGGPRCSSLLGAFEEQVSPFYLNDEGKLFRNPYGWNKAAHVLFVDNPIGTGFSTVDNDASYATNQEQVSDDLYQLLNKFLEMHPEYQQSEWILSGESYAGKYIPNLAQKILINQQKSGNLVRVPSALLIGDGLIDPLIQRNIRPEQAYYNGFISSKQLEQESSLREQCIRHIQSGNTQERSSPCEAMRNFIMLNSGIVNIYDIRTYYPSNNKTILESYFNQEQFKQAVHTTRTKPYITCNPIIYDYLKNDILINIKKMIPQLSKHMRIVLFAGNFDLQDGPIGTEQMLLSMGDIGEAFAKAPRNLWFSSVNNVVAGYEQVLGNISYVIVHGAGHYVPQHQPSNSLDVLTRVTKNQRLCVPGESIPLSYTDLVPAEYKRFFYDMKLSQYRLPCEVSQIVCERVLHGCNENGKCVNGYCVCKDGFAGEQCLTEVVDGTSVLSHKAENVPQQTWKHVKIAVPLSKRNVVITLSWSKENATYVRDVPPPILGLPNGKICLYTLRDKLPTHTNHESSRCTSSDTEIVLSSSYEVEANNVHLYVAVFNGQPFPVSYTLSYTTSPVEVNQWTTMLSMWQFWILFGLLGLVILGLLIAFIVAMTYIRKKLNPDGAVRLPD